MLAQIRKIRKDDGGFTLIELLMVIVIIGILAAIVTFSVKGITDTGEAAACNADLKTVETAVEAYYAEHDGVYPTSFDDLTPEFLRSEPESGVALGAGGAVTPGPDCD